MQENNAAPGAVSARCLARQSRSGTAVAKLIRGEKLEEDAKAQPAPRKSMKKTKFTDPSEFLAGPGQPGQITHGPRRFHAANKDTVGKMLLDDFIMGNQGAIVVDDRSRCKQMSAKSHLSHLTSVCGVTEEPAPFRTQIHIDAAARATGVPYSLDNDPRPAPGPDRAGRRLFKNDAAMRNLLLGLDEAGQPAAPLPPPSASRARANASVDVLNLGKYDARALREVRPTTIQHGPRRCDPPELPPRPRPQIRPMNVAAKEEHDILGTGRGGKAVPVMPSGKGRGVARPPERNEIFGGVVVPAATEKGAATAVTKKAAVTVVTKKGAVTAVTGGAAQRPASGSRATIYPSNPDLLRYYDPALDGPAEPVAQRKQGNRSNLESDHDAPLHASVKAKGLFHDRYVRDTPGLLEYA